MYLTYGEENKGYIEACQFMDGLIRDIFDMYKPNAGELILEMSSVNAYIDGKVPIDYKKKSDLQKTVRHVPYEYKDILLHFGMTHNMR
ncbi:hypothetical protein PR048_014116 [Dryococelus australis]|uniref:Uncharacterized protein n=1 Tax=Dryococelus australis TaxID=614101 RepID=A0ABQ9HDG1_9NEOP|nr:hypothetical protein PR048_014116 [Dryococelus australis]